ncbi:hypothetical protein BT96DRAFT_933082 [Gymnopus androsaceus JB14]|uniref:Uncharacterized protein n=1 Tax=Gymnopus androsaceus JB14 TaxID=1447944 RepID=A0A6A4ID14_9AGAR|nr:hypothetical protein BT96DRAFT_933082 [Gymnopus androsaceus JB14]
MMIRRLTRKCGRWLREEQIAIVRFHEPTKDFQKCWEVKRQEARERSLKEVMDHGITYKARAPHQNMAKELVRGEMRKEFMTHGECLQYYHDSETHVHEFRKFTEEELAEIQRVNARYRELNEEMHQGQCCFERVIPDM